MLRVSPYIQTSSLHRSPIPPTKNWSRNRQRILKGLSGIGHLVFFSQLNKNFITKVEVFTTQLNNSLYLHEEEFVSCFITTMWSFAKTTTMVLVEASVEPLGKDLKNRTPDIFFKSNLKHPTIHCVYKYWNIFTHIISFHFWSFCQKREVLDLILVSR